MNLSDVDSKYSFLFFIGSGRTGSTLLGQLINYHPECLISNESRFLDKVVVHHKPYVESFEEMINSAYEQFELGLENSSYFKDKINKYQSCWVDMGNLSEKDYFNKKAINLVGDKKAGGTTNILRHNGPDLLNFVNENLQDHPVKFIQIIRNPLYAGISYMKSHGISTFTEACNKVVDDTLMAANIKESISPDAYYSLYYEDLIESPYTEIKNIFTWLNKDCDETWLKEVCLLVKDNKKEISIPHQIRQEFIKIVDASQSSIFDRYLE